jgi:hypothetical protein
MATIFPWIFSFSMVVTVIIIGMIADYITKKR